MIALERVAVEPHPATGRRLIHCIVCGERPTAPDTETAEFMALRHARLGKGSLVALRCAALDVRAAPLADPRRR